MPATTSTFASRIRRLTSVILVMAVAIFGLSALLPTLGTIPDLLALRRAEARLRAEKAAKLDDTLDLTDEVGQTIAGLGDARVIAGGVVRSAETAYLETIRRDVLSPAFERLGAQIRREEDWLERRDRLAAYLMLGGRGPIDDRAARLLVPLCVDVVAARSSKSEAARSAWIERHVGGYLRRLERGAAPWLPVDETVIAEAKAALSRAPLLDRLDQYATNWVTRAVCVAEPRYPPMTLETLFADRPDVLRVLGSRRGGPRPEIGGAYTEKGHAALLVRLHAAERDFAENAWLLPLGPEEQGPAFAASLRRFHDAYAARQVDQWMALIEDITLRPQEPGDIESTLTRILQHVARATEIPQLERLPHGPCDTSPHVGPRFGSSGRPIDSPVSPERAALAWWAEVGGGAPPAAKKLAGMAALARDGLIARWIPRLQKAQRDRMYEQARKETEADFAALDEVTRRIWLPLLLEPLRDRRPQ